MEKSSNKTKKYFQKDPNAFYINAYGKIRARSVHGDDNIRINKASEGAEKSPVPVEDVIRHCNNFLQQIGIQPVENPVMDPKKLNYSELKNRYNLSNCRDLIWLKFTTSGHVGVVAKGADVNFDIPPTAHAYDEKDQSQRWRYSTSGIIIHKLGKQWDTSFVLVFPLPLQGLEMLDYTSGDIETAVGNYLIEKGVPILDFYSHNY